MTSCYFLPWPLHNVTWQQQRGNFRHGGIFRETTCHILSFFPLSHMAVCKFLSLKGLRHEISTCSLVNSLCKTCMHECLIAFVLTLLAVPCGKSPNSGIKNALRRTTTRGGGFFCYRPIGVCVKRITFTGIFLGLFNSVQALRLGGGDLAVEWALSSK